MSIFVGGRGKFGSTDGGRTPKKSEGVRTFTRYDLRVAIYRYCPTLSRAEARKIFDETFDEVSDALVRGEPVKLRHFGAFNLAPNDGAPGATQRPGWKQ